MSLEDKKPHVGYGKFIKRIKYLIDLCILNLMVYFLPYQMDFKYPSLFYFYISITWVIISVYNRYYDIYRYTRLTQIVYLLVRQFISFFLFLYAYIGFFMEKFIDRYHLGIYLICVFALITLIKFAFRFVLIKYRKIFRRNIMRVVVLGDGKKPKQLIRIFNEKDEYGFEFVKQFSVKENRLNLQELFDFILGNSIDEVYCSINELSNKQIHDIIIFCDTHIKTLKFIPDNKNIFQKRLKFEYYDFLPILSLRDIPLENPLNAFFKRSFDVVFAICVYVFLLSWLTPLLALLIYLDNPGPVYFVQNRPGYKGTGFNCYKFRTMKINSTTEVSASRNDTRVTKLGKFLRRTSLDELPQFINVLYGNMSVVGPRPHLWRQNEEYGEEIKKYMVRHYVKPGITGLAQSKGFRGGIETRDDIVNRTRYDVFYIENWSFLLDIKIIIQTAINVFRGEENAY
ncbi:exopolysaccharide biosynthesis polyprenyl glycosylphosphotransferase [Flavobacterium sp. ASW18X]|uniref:exopolysaccharide biosynthesis polyprenyl glycosylphosphotransferase n=1 Tax=Flavobacterium sp. ASW18X TaxID=2572595 RepID=UPI0010ADDA72|nr:exopolysaccharide biosynthesis polyprenyl glycosylphosphotransferase [Flavobacterium sp. ASW18X]TKD65089.1 exopolysaccharide biosynthesis polyprenyl glycosylphosphotransferase [Flavobacterium sp. ASW18X]